MSSDPKPELTDKGGAGKAQPKIQPTVEKERKRLTSDTQQGQSEADRLQAADASGKKKK
jgi:hypothetical protein